MSVHNSIHKLHDTSRNAARAVCGNDTLGAKEAHFLLLLCDIEDHKSVICGIGHVGFICK